MAILVVNPELFTKPGLEPVPGTRIDHKVISLTAAQLAAANIYAIGILPANCKLMHCILETQQLDTGSNATITVGVLNNYVLGMATNAAATAWSAASTYSCVNLDTAAAVTYASTTPDIISSTSYYMFTADTSCRTATASRVSSTLAFTNAIGVDTKDRIIAMKFAVLPQTPQAGNFGLFLFIDPQ